MGEQKYWYGTVIGTDIFGNEVCKQINKPTFNQKSYRIAVNRENTGINLTVRSGETSNAIDQDAMSIFNAMTERE